MSTGIISKKYLIDIANAIREKCNTQSQYTPSQMPSAIRAIDDGTIKTIEKSSNDDIGLISDTLLTDICDAIRDSYDDQSLYFTPQSAADAILAAPGYGEFSLFDQPGLTGTGGNFSKQSDGSWYGPKDANTAYSWSKPIPKEYKYLAIDVESSGNTGSYNVSDMALTTQYGTRGSMMADYNGTRLLYANITSYSYTRPKQASEQSRVIIDPTSQYVVPRQTVYIDISDIDQDAYLFWHKCDNATRIYSVNALMQVPATTYTITYTPGDVCTATDGINTYTAPDTSGTWTLTGRIFKLTVTAVNEDSGAVVTKTVKANFENGAVINVSTLTTFIIAYDAGNICTATDGTNTYTAPDTSGSWTLQASCISLTVTSTNEVTGSTYSRTIQGSPSNNVLVYMFNNRYAWTEYSVYDSTGLSSSGWSDNAGIHSLTKNSGSWVVENGALVCNGSWFSFPVPNSNVLIGWKGTISSGWTPNSNSNWYQASCLFGHELGGSQKDFACIIRPGIIPSIGYSTSSIQTGSISLTPDTEHTIFLLHTGSAYYLWVDGSLAANVSYTASGAALNTMGLFWNADYADISKVKGTCSKLGVWTFSLDNPDADIVLPNF